VLIMKLDVLGRYNCLVLFGSHSLGFRCRNKFHSNSENIFFPH